MSHRPHASAAAAFAALAALLPACAHRTPAPGAAEAAGAVAPADPGPDAAGTPSAPADRPDLEPARAATAAVLTAQGELLWRAFTTGEPVEPARAWAGRESLLQDATLREVSAAVAAATGDEQRAAAYLRAWLLGERLAHEVARPAGAAAAARADATFRWNGRLVPLREAVSLLAGEHDRDRRRVLAETAAASAKPVAQADGARDAALRDAIRALGYASPLALAAEVRGESPERLGAAAEAVLHATDVTWRKLLDDLARREGLQPADVRARDLPRLLRTPLAARLFPGDRQLERATALLAGLGADATAWKVDREPRVAKLPEAVAIPVDPPGDVRLSLTPMAGLDALRAVLREAAVAAAARGLKEERVEFRRLGPTAIPEAWATLVEEVAGSPEWLAEQGVPIAEARAEARAAAARRLYRAREAAARVLAGLGRSADAAGAASREAALLALATGCPPDKSDPVAWRIGADPLLRSAEALQAELLAAQVERQLTARAGGGPWWKSPASGAWLREAWAAGSRRTPAEISASLGEAALDAGALVALAGARAE